MNYPVPSLYMYVVVGMDSASYELLTLEAEYACFNSRRTLLRANTGSARWTVRGDEVLIENEDWPDNTYINRVSTVSPELRRIETERPRFRRIDYFVRTACPSIVPEVARMKRIRKIDFFRHDLRGSNAAFSPGEIRTELCRDAELFIGEISRSMEMDFDPAIVRAKRSLYCTKNFRGYLARIDGEIVGLATLFVHERAGWLGNAFTFPAHRMRGVQTELLRARVEEGRNLGLAFAYTDTPSDGETTRNVLRTGFRAVARSETYEFALT